MTQELAIIENKSAVEVYGCNAVEKLIGKMEQEAGSVVFDVEKPSDRKAARSLAYKISQSKTHLDNLGKELVTGWKAKAKAVDAERKVVRDRMDALRDKVKAPVIEWEETQARIAEEQRIEAEKIAREKRIAEEIELDYETALGMDKLWDREQEIARKEAQLKAEENERIAKEAAERIEQERIEREARIAKEAQQKATLKAEQEARARIQAAEQAKADAERKAQEKIAAAQRATQKAEREAAEAIEAEQKRAEQARIAEERERKHEEARIAAEAKRKAAEAERKAANKRHQGCVNRKAVAALIEGGISEETAKAVLTLIIKGDVPNVSVKY